MREADYRAGLANAYSQGDEPRLVRVISGGHDEVWAVGNSMFIIPAVPADAPPLLEYAIRLRREATLTGKCSECSATVGLGAFGQLVELPINEARVPHRRNCPASDENLKRQLSAHRSRSSQRTVMEAFEAASANTRSKIFESPSNKIQVTNPKFERWAKDLLDAKLSSDRCEHLASGPAQTWNSYVASSEWRCDQCFAYLQASIVEGGPLFDATEERTCDHCRQFADVLEPVIIRIDHFVMIGGVCANCAKKFNPVIPPKKVKKSGKNRRKRR
ncbi:hypothetical protein ACFVIM_02770 [Streptomyces sp. NPDC057638]|uniref:hypothetical protein n=1 Tax=Streptomyces sp. NPDC057638 TaxID=3346190 RepID=UPI0036A3F603